MKSTEIKTFNGVPIADTKAREDISALKEDLASINSKIVDAVNAYLTEHPVSGVTPAQIASAVESYLAEHPVQGGGVTEEYVLGVVQQFGQSALVEVGQMLELYQKKTLVTPIDFGAVGDGVIDDTQAFQNAISYASEKGHAFLYIPNGVYIISSTLLLHNNFSLIGESQRDTIIRASDQFVGDDMVVVGDSYDYNFKYARLNEIRLECKNKCNGIRMANTCDMHRVTIFEPINGIYTDATVYRDDIKLRNIYVYGATGEHNIYVNGNNDGLLMQNIKINNKDNQIADVSINMNHGGLLTNSIVNCPLYVNRSVGLSIVGIHSENHNYNSVVIEASTVTIKDCYKWKNSEQTKPDYDIKGTNAIKSIVTFENVSLITGQDSVLPTSPSYSVDANSMINGCPIIAVNTGYVSNTYSNFVIGCNSYVNMDKIYPSKTNVFKPITAVAVDTANIFSSEPINGNLKLYLAPTDSVGKFYQMINRNLTVTDKAIRYAFRSAYTGFVHALLTVDGVVRYALCYMDGTNQIFVSSYGVNCVPWEAKEIDTSAFTALGTAILCHGNEVITEFA